MIRPGPGTSSFFSLSLIFFPFFFCSSLCSGTLFFPETPAKPLAKMQYAGQDVLPPTEDVYAEAFAFRMLVQHLRSVADEASNIDVMSVAGMCRNCLCKWYHAGTHAAGRGVTYDEACEVIYGEPYGAWKKKHQKPATPDQLAKFEATKPFHAKHEKDLEAWRRGLRVPTPTVDVPKATTTTSIAGDPCCYQEEDGNTVKQVSAPTKKLRVGVLTVSDRASSGVYPDQGAPAVLEELRSQVDFDLVATKIVPDDVTAIQDVLTSWADPCNLILTTGGTGFGPRDVTPEATTAVLTKQAPAIMNIVHARALQDSSHLDSLLSRAVAGVRGHCVILNLPGRPAAARYNLRLLLPTLANAVALADHSSSVAVA